MSAYGVIVRTAAATALPSTAWRAPSKSGAGSGAALLTLHHISLPAARAHAGFLAHLHTEFADEVGRGVTYPQETADGAPLARDAFDAYFFAADVVVAIVGTAPGSALADVPGGEGEGAREVDVSLESARAGREWQDCVAGFYYIKPNYPGRSSHICNAGFVVPHAHRGRGYGSVLARSYLHYAPRLGYRASVFNLVFVNNTASLRLWDSLGFTRAGRIPQAGRLRCKKPNGEEGEEYVDALVYYKSFISTSEGGPEGKQDVL